MTMAGTTSYVALKKRCYRHGHSSPEGINDATRHNGPSGTEDSMLKNGGRRRGNLPEAGLKLKEI